VFKKNLLNAEKNHTNYLSHLLRSMIVFAYVLQHQVIPFMCCFFVSNVHIHFNGLLFSYKTWTLYIGFGLAVFYCTTLSFFVFWYFLLNLDTQYPETYLILACEAFVTKRLFICPPLNFNKSTFFK